MIIEITEFELVKGASAEEFLSEHNRVHREWAVHQSGLIWRETIRSDDGVWRDIVAWESLDLFQGAVARLTSETNNLPWLAMIDNASTKVHHGEVMTDFSGLAKS